MTEGQTQVSAGRRSDLPLAVEELDDDLKRTLRRTSYMRQGFYIVVLLVALAGQVSGAVEALHIPLIAAIPAVAALELGGIVVLANADVRRRLGEKAIASRLLSAVIAAWAVAFNWLAHTNHLLGGFFAGMSALGYLVWLMHTENQRRDRLRAKGDLAPTTPAYEFVGHWLRHPFVTTRARSLAKANPGLGLYESLAAAQHQIRREHRHAAISKVLHRKIRSAVDPNTADIAVAVYDLDEIAVRLADSADYDGLTALIGADLAPDRLGVDAKPPARGPRRRRVDTPAAIVAETPPAAISAEPTPVLNPDLRRVLESRLAPTRRPIAAEPAEPVLDATEVDPIQVTAVTPPTGRHSAGTAEPERAPKTTRATRTPAQATAADKPRRRTAPAETAPPAPPEMSLRNRVHATLDEHVPAGDERDSIQLMELVAGLLDLNDLERHSAQMYVSSWKTDVETGKRVPAPADQPRGARS